MNFFEVIALLSIGYIFPLPFWWFLIHSKFNFLRRFGYGYHLLMGAIWILLGWSLFNYSSKILSYRLETKYTFFAGIILALLVAIIDLKRQQNFSFTTIIGLPEMLPKRYKSKLVDQGIFSYIRHPRYLEYMLFALAMAFITGLAVTYAFFIYCVIFFYLLAVYEEKELVKRFGKKYVVYMNRVPRFVPRI